MNWHKRGWNDAKYGFTYLPDNKENLKQYEKGYKAYKTKDKDETTVWLTSTELKPFQKFCKEHEINIKLIHQMFPPSICVIVKDSNQLHKWMESIQ